MFEWIKAPRHSIIDGMTGTQGSTAKKKHAEQHQQVNIKSLISISPLQKYTLYLKYSAYNCSASLATLKKKKATVLLPTKKTFL